MWTILLFVQAQPHSETLTLCRVDAGKLRGEKTLVEQKYGDGLELIAGKATATRQGSQLRVDEVAIGVKLQAILVEKNSGPRLKTAELLCLAGGQLKTIYSVELSKIDEQETETRCDWKFAKTAHNGAFDIAQHCKTTHIELGEDEQQQRITLTFDGDRYR